jgi:GntR family transcriptional regulator/MocR family aminotransferase
MGPYRYRMRRLPSTRSLARTLGVSRNTVITAYEELVTRGLIRSRPGAGMYVFVPVGPSDFKLKAVMREAQYPSRTIALQDPDGNPLCVGH